MALATRWIGSHNEVNDTLDVVKQKLAADNVTQLQGLLHSEHVHFEHCIYLQFKQLRDRSHSKGCQVESNLIAPTTYDGLWMDVDMQAQSSGWTEAYFMVGGAATVGEWELHWSHGKKKQAESFRQPSGNLAFTGGTPLLHSVDIQESGPVCFKVRAEKQPAGNANHEENQPLYAMYFVATDLAVASLGAGISGSYTSSEGPAPDPMPPEQQLSCS